ncbi:LamG-like jellyroll fold domain-containing protein, partial [Candidatus Hydrogenedentota bacterium]
TKEPGPLRYAWARVVRSVIGAAMVASIALVFGLVLFTFWPTFGESAGVPQPPLPVVKEFVENGGDYMAGRHFRHLYAMAQQTKRIVPEGSRVFFSSEHALQVRMRYYMMPELTMLWEAKDWDYFVDYDSSLFARPAGSTRILLDVGDDMPPVAMYSAPGKTFTGQGLTDAEGNLVPGVVGKALAFDGVDDSVVVPEAQVSHVFAADADFSVAFWWRSDSDPFPDGHKEVFSNYTPDRGGIVLHQRGNASGTDTRIYMNFYVAGGGAPIFQPATGGAENIGQWHHYVFQREGSTLRAWCDGALRGSYTNPAVTGGMGDGVDVRVNSFRLGAKGALDDLRIYARALTESEIIDYNNSLSTRPDGSKQIPLESGNGKPPVALHSAPGKTFADRGLIDTNGHLVPGIAGKALAFDGVDDSVVIPEAQIGKLFDAETDFSVAFWWRSDSDPFPDGYRQVLSNYAPDSGGIILYQRGDAQGMGARIYMNFYVAGNGAPVFQPVTSGSENIGQWHHYVFQREGPALRAWRDGALLNSYTHPVARESMGKGVDLHLSSFRLGAKGALDDLQVFSRALSDIEIQGIAAQVPTSDERADTIFPRLELPQLALHLTMDADEASLIGVNVSEGQAEKNLGEQPVSNPKDKADSTLRTLFWFIALQSLSLLGGCFLLSLLRGQSLGTIHGHLYSLALAYLLGFVWNNGIIILLAAAGIPLSALLVLACYMSLPVLLGLFVRKADILRLFIIPFGCVREMSFRELALTSVFGSLALALFFWVTASAIFDPIYRWDAVSHWLPKARVIYGFDGFRFHLTHHNEYPILWPLSIAVHFFFTGYHADYVAHWLVGLFLIVMLVILYHGARITRLGPAGSAAAIVAFFLFLYNDILLTAYAESLFTLFFAASVVMVLERLVLSEPKRRDYLLAAIVFLGLTLTKTDGHLAVLIIGIAWALVLPVSTHSLRHYKRWFPTILICMIPPYAWISWQRHHGFLSSGNVSVMSDGPPDWERIKVWFEVCVYHIAKIDAKHMMFAAGIVMLIAVALRVLLKRTDFQTLFLITIGMAAFSLMSILGWNSELLRVHFLGAVPRQFLHGTPALFLACTMVLGEVSRGSMGKNKCDPSLKGEY